ncbi:hypothetical protein QAD02_007163 [Eretmocerus hayati]|uniref:Uncharacterized protein n=1 Tax=Eretmocerus hayati TaxID=131215 RepID=A0ACC2N482_9HYME|nr:hypothetical protein QAD02_007163 [Eretmocerus hayati]
MKTRPMITVVPFIHGFCLSVDRIQVDEYILIFNHTTSVPNISRTFLEAKFRNSTYTALSTIDPSRQAILSIHLDTWRDIDVTVTGIDEGVHKEYGISILWDASRDPKIKFSLSSQLYKPVLMNGEKALSLDISFSYPGRQLTGSCSMISGIWNHQAFQAHVTWSDTDSIRLAVETERKFEDRLKSISFRSQVVTPFERWRRTSLESQYIQSDSEAMVYGDVHWQDQHIFYDMRAMAISSERGSADYRLNFGLISSLPHIKSVIANLTHLHTYAERIDSHVLVKYESDRVIEMRSTWAIQNFNDDKFNVTGILYLRSPIANFRKGDLQCYWSCESDWDFKGAAYMDLDRKKYTARLVADLANLLETMVSEESLM